MTIDHASVYPKIYPVIGFIARKRLGNLFIFTQYGLQRIVKKYYYPEQPRTGAQQGNKMLIYDAVYNWTHFSEEEKEYYNAKRWPFAYDGYRRYISLYIKANAPMIIYWDTLEKNASDTKTIPAYMASDYFGGVERATLLKTTAKMSAYPSQSQGGIANGVSTQVILDKEEYDNGGNFANNIFTAPADGYYLINGMVYFKTDTVVANKRYFARINKNGNILKQSAKYSSDTNGFSVDISLIEYLEIGDTVELFVYHEAGVNTVYLLSGQTNNRLQIHQLS